MRHGSIGINDSALKKGHGHGHGHGDKDKHGHGHDDKFEGTSVLTPYLLLLALSMHSVFEGFAIGL